MGHLLEFFREHPLTTLLNERLAHLDREPASDEEVTDEESELTEAIQGLNRRHLQQEIQSTIARISSKHRTRSVAKKNSGYVTFWHKKPLCPFRHKASSDLDTYRSLVARHAFL